ncbi:MAG: hypothetical protein KY429_10035 [Actinobacteria bacterium]|nr:hypothetical protein [Actinomycetota bacterium]
MLRRVGPAIAILVALLTVSCSGEVRVDTPRGEERARDDPCSTPGMSCDAVKQAREGFPPSQPPPKNEPPMSKEQAVATAYSYFQAPLNAEVEVRAFPYGEWADLSSSIDHSIHRQRAVWVVTVHWPNQQRSGPPSEPRPTYDVYTVVFDVASGFEVGLYQGGHV